MSIYNKNGNRLNNVYSIYNKSGNVISAAFNIDGEKIFSASQPLPIPSGNLIATSTVVLPDIYNNGHGWTCTGLAYDEDSNEFLVGDIGKALPSDSGYASQIIKISSDFTTVSGSIPLYTVFPAMSDIQGITIDTSDGTIWFCSTSENLIRHITFEGTSIGSISLSAKPTGICYSPKDDSFWILTYADTNNIQRINKSGVIQEQYSFNYSVTLDQCFLDSERGYLYITAGENYSNLNDIYLFDTTTHEQSITCTVDSYSVEGIWISENNMVIVNDGYYHSAYDNRNVANIYTL